MTRSQIKHAIRHSLPTGDVSQELFLECHAEVLREQGFDVKELIEADRLLAGHVRKGMLLMEKNTTDNVYQRAAAMMESKNQSPRSDPKDTDVRATYASDADSTRDLAFAIARSLKSSGALTSSKRSITLSEAKEANARWEAREAARLEDLRRTDPIAWAIKRLS